MSLVDPPAPVRPEAAFDLAALSAWLRGRCEPELDAGDPELLQFGGGFSNLTYLVRFGAREFVVRRAPPGVDIKSAHDMGREFRILSALAPAWGKAPKPLAHCDDPRVIGTPFYVMQRVRGVILRAQDDGRPGGRLSLDARTMRRVSMAACDSLVEIHRIDWRAAGLGTLGKPDGYVGRQVRGWAERWRRARTDDVPRVEKLGAWLEEHQPAESGATLVHNDFKYDNVILAENVFATPPSAGGGSGTADDVIAVLDWEMATVGDPLMDLGTALGYWVELDDPPGFQGGVFGPTNLPGNLTRREFTERWSRGTGRAAENVLYYYAFALFKLAVVKQQLYKRWTAGLTREERYRGMLTGVHAVANAAALAIDKGRIDRLGA